MHAQPGDRLVIRGHHVGDADRDGEILQVQGKHGEPPYLVRWSHDGHEAFIFPGSDAVIEHPKRKAPAKLKSKAPAKLKLAGPR
jgi:hypothetical protein